ncbi:MAG: hypothetical protein HGA87_07450 [Desulfobulbaceae bacterium]|nr:hypothetical protein [Desulfobulbaceae bacterium]
MIEQKQSLNDATPALLQKVAMDAAGLKLTIKSEDINSCTNLRKLIETYKVQGGPSPAETTRMLKVRNKTLAASKKSIADLNAQLANADSTLNKAVTTYSAIKAQKP